VAEIAFEEYGPDMDLRRMEDLIDELRPEEIADALGLLRLFERVGQSTPEESEALRRRIEARAESLRGRRRGLHVVRS
jgi:hypothetical protein